MRNTDDSWVSDSPYIHVFDDLDKVHHQMEENSLVQTLKGIGYDLVAQTESPLPTRLADIMTHEKRKEHFLWQ